MNDSTEMLEIRLAWHLLNVSDPSGRNVFDDEGTPEIEYSKTEGFNIFLFITDKEIMLIRNFLLSNRIFIHGKLGKNQNFKLD